MFDSKLLETIRVMNSSEVLEFMESPYYHDRRVRKEITQLFEYIIEDHPDCSRGLLSKEATHRHLFGEKPYGENRLNHIMTGLLRLLESYIIAKFSHIHDETEQMFALARFYQERDLHSRFDATIGRLEEVLQSIVAEDEDVLWRKYQVEYLKHLQSGLYHQRNTDLNLIPALSVLDSYYIAQRLILSAGLLTQKQLAKVDTSQTMVIYELMSNWGDFAVETAQKPLIQAYYKLLPLLTDEADMPYLVGFRNTINQFRKNLSPIHLKGLFTAIRNFLVNKYNNGDSEILPLLFSNLQDEYEQGFLHEPNGMMRASTYQNVVTTALKLKYFEWTRSFMNNCSQVITGTADPENVILFNEANYSFHIGDHDMSLDTGFHLQKNDNFVYNLASRRLEIKIWFEKGDLDMAEYRLNALKSYLFSNKKNIPDQMKRNNDDFVDIFRQLMSPRNMGNPKRMAALREKFSNDRKNIAEREWFLEKLDAYKSPS